MTLHDRALDHMVARLVENPGRCHGTGCRCARCRHDAVEAGPSAVVSGRYGTPATTFTLTDWKGWTAGVGLKDLLELTEKVDVALGGRIRRNDAIRFTGAVLDEGWRRFAGRSEPMPARFRGYFVRSQNLYRIGPAGDRTHATYIGMTAPLPVALRVFRHMTAGSAAATGNLPSYLRKGGSGVYRRIKTSPVRRIVPGTLAVPGAMANYVVHIGAFSRKFVWDGNADNRFLHVYESLLQRRELRRTAYRATSHRWTFDE